jgi:gamma-glutamyl-gamma-aminobutyraldehyde dehydrogenase
MLRGIRGHERLRDKGFLESEMKTRNDWETAAAALSFDGRAVINGARVATEKTSEDISPVTAKSLTEVAECGQREVDQAVASSRAAFENGWSRMSPGARKTALQNLSGLILANADELALLDVLDMGKPISDATTIDIPGSAAILNFYAEAIDKVSGEIPVTDPGNVALVRRVPLGVVGAVVPWNYPLEMAIWKLGPALAAGNTVVLKPAEQSPLSSLRLAELALEAGLPEGTLNVVTGQGETTGAAIGLHPDIDVLTFTGSTQVGKYFMKYSGESNMKQVWLECGGKSPNLVFADTANLEEAAEFAARAIFFNQGEVCSANSRLLVERSIAEQFTELVVAQAKLVKLGNPLDPATTMGPLVDRTQTGRVADFITNGSGGAQLAHGGNRLTIDGSDCYVEPTIFANVSTSSSIATDEIFGPVLSVIPFDAETEAIAIANNSIYGLAASVWTSNLSRAHRVSDALHAGTVSVNTVDALGMNIPFGGFKQSGFGRDLSLHALDKYTGLKTTWIRYEN